MTTTTPTRDPVARVHHRGRIAGPVGEEHAVRLPREDLVGGGARSSPKPLRVSTGASTSGELASRAFAVAASPAATCGRWRWTSARRSVPRRAWWP